MRSNIVSREPHIFTRTLTPASLAAKSRQLLACPPCRARSLACIRALLVGQNVHRLMDESPVTDAHFSRKSKQ